MAERFGTAVQIADGRAVIVLRGELDLVNAGELDDVLGQDDVGAAGALVLDLTELKFLDSSGLRALLRAQELAAGRGQDFAVTPGSGQVQRLLNITHASDQLPIVGTAGTAP